VLVDRVVAVASDSTCWRELKTKPVRRLCGIKQARAAAREVAWAQRGEVTGSVIPPARAVGRPLPRLVIGLDVTIVICHSAKEQTAATFKHTFG
jgi:hypothetical protein